MTWPLSIHGQFSGLRLSLFKRDRRRVAERNRARFRLEGLEDRCLLSGISGYTEYPVPSGNSPYQITSGPDGNLWFTEWVSGANKVGMINPTTHAVSEFTTPTSNSRPYGIAAGSDGNIWFTEWGAHKIGMINPTTHVITEFAISTGGVQKGITAGPDGNLWFAQGGGIGKINPTTHAITLFSVGSNITCNGITSGPDGNIWFTEDNNQKIGMINPTTGAISQFALPLPAGAEPWGIAAGSDGNLWFTEYSSSTIGMINPTTHAITEFANPAGDSSAITAGPDGNLWFGTGGMGSISPATGTIAVYAVPAKNGITSGPDGNIWFTDSGKVGIATLSSSGSQLAVTQEPPATVTAGTPFGLTVDAEDNSGNLLSSFNGSVTLTLANSPSGAVLGGTLTTTAVNGVATFSGLSLTMVSSASQIDASSSALAIAFTTPIAVTPAAASQVVITTQPPSTVTANTAFGLQATIEDAYGNVVTLATNTLSVAIANNPGGATLGGTTSVAAVNGLVNFSGLTLNKAGTGYTLQVAGVGLTGATTSPITVKKSKVVLTRISHQGSGIGLPFVS